MGGLSNTPKIQRTHTYKLPDYCGIVLLVYSETWVKTFLHTTVRVKSQKLYKQPSYSQYQEYLYRLCRTLKDEGLGYRRIHKVLVDEGWDVGTSPTCVHTMIKKMNKRDFILSQPTTTRFENIGIQIF